MVQKQIGCRRGPYAFFVPVEQKDKDLFKDIEIICNDCDYDVISPSLF